MNKEKIEIDIETLRGIFLILCGVSYSHSGSEVYDKAKPIMTKAHLEILEMGKKMGFDVRGSDI